VWKDGKLASIVKPEETILSMGKKKYLVSFNHGYRQPKTYLIGKGPDE